MGLDQNYIDSMIDSLQRRITQWIERHGGLWLIISIMHFELSGFIFIHLFQNDDIVLNWKIKRLKLKSGFFFALYYSSAEDFKLENGNPEYPSCIIKRHS